jgi:hypothetical protein
MRQAITYQGLADLNEDLLLNHLLCFGQRVYWKRLWGFQEL